MKLFVLVVLGCVAILQAQPFMGVDPIGDVGFGVGDGIGNIIQDSIGMALNGADAMKTGFLDAEDGLRYAIDGGMENGFGMGDLEDLDGSDEMEDDID